MRKTFAPLIAAASLIWSGSAAAATFVYTGNPDRPTLAISGLLGDPGVSDANGFHLSLTNELPATGYWLVFNTSEPVLSATMTSPLTPHVFQLGVDPQFKVSATGFHLLFGAQITPTFDVVFAPGFEGQAFTATFTALPEPATWAMMILGFGLVGSSLRQRRPAAALKVR